MRALRRTIFTLSGLLLLLGSLECASAVEQGTEISKARSKQHYGDRKLTKEATASLGAKLANEKSKTHFDREPFKPEHHEPVLRRNRWRWGGLDPAGIDGYSAKVSFDLFGGRRKVEVYFSNDALRPIKPLPPPRGAP